MTDETLFAAALDHTDPTDRRKYLDGACPDPQQRERVEKLLAALGQASDFLERPAVGAAPEPGPTRRGGGPAGDSEPEESEEPIDFLEPPLRPDSLGRLGHYEVLQLVGRGGFGIVFRAFDDVLQRVVAIKVLSAEMASTSPARKRFVREARGYAAVRHENVVTVHAIEPEPRPYIVMEFVPGETLEKLITRTGPIDVADVVRIGSQIARGLSAAHAQGIIHRDIKPANVLIENGPDRKVKLTDFGLARAADDASLTQSGMIAGTPMFMAPEQAYGTPLDHRADLFSLGSVLYTLVTGRAPFRAATSIAVLRRVAEDDPRPIRDVIPEVPQGLIDVIAKLHAKNPDNRFQSATEVADTLDHCLTAPPKAELQKSENKDQKEKAESNATTDEYRNPAPVGSLSALLNPPAPPGNNWLLGSVLMAVFVVLPCAVAVYIARPGSITTELTRSTEPPPFVPPGPPLPGPPPLPKQPLPQPPLPKPKLPPLPPQLPALADLLTAPDWEWGEPKSLDPNVNNGERTLDAALTSDELEIVFARGKLGETKLYTSRRKSINDDFGPAELLPAAVNTGKEASSLSGDGLTLAFTRSSGPNTEDVWVSERASRDVSFGEPVKLPAVVNVNAPGAWVRAPVLSADGRTLLVTATARAKFPGGDIAMFVREPGGTFAHHPLPGSPINTPAFDAASWISEDQRVLIRVMHDGATRECRFHVRKSADEPFGAGQKFAITRLPETVEVGRPWLSPDGSRMYFHAPSSFTDKEAPLNIWVTERKPKAK